MAYLTCAVTLAAWFMALFISSRLLFLLSGDSAIRATCWQSCLERGRIATLSSRNQPNYHSWRRALRSCQEYQRCNFWLTSFVAVEENASNFTASSCKRKVNLSANWTWKNSSSARGCWLRQLLVFSTATRHFLPPKWPNYWFLTMKRVWCLETQIAATVNMIKPERTKSRQARASIPTKLPKISSIVTIRLTRGCLSFIKLSRHRIKRLT